MITNIPFIKEILDISKMKELRREINEFVVLHHSLRFSPKQEERELYRAYIHAARVVNSVVDKYS